MSTHESTTLTAGELVGAPDARPPFFSGLWGTFQNFAKRTWRALTHVFARIERLLHWPTLREGPMCVCAILLWLMLFTAGMAVNSRSFTDALESTVKTLDQQIPAFDRFVNLIWGCVLVTLVLFTYTSSNVALLCLLASQIGAFSSRMYEAQKLGRDSLPPSPSRYLAALAGGFLIYLIVMSGSYTILSLPFQTPPVGSSGTEEAQKQYKTLATLASIVCFIEGFQAFAIPTVNRWLRNRSGVDGREAQRVEALQAQASAVTGPSVPTEVLIAP